jgi:hypothetical protein
MDPASVARRRASRGGPRPAAAGILPAWRQLAMPAIHGPRERGEAEGQPIRAYSPITFTSTRLGRRPSNSP